MRLMSLWKSKRHCGRLGSIVGHCWMLGEQFGAEALPQGGGHGERVGDTVGGWVEL